MTANSLEHITEPPWASIWASVKGICCSSVAPLWAQVTKNGYFKQVTADSNKRGDSVPMSQPDFEVSWSLLRALQGLIEDLGRVVGGGGPGREAPGQRGQLWPRTVRARRGNQLELFLNFPMKRLPCEF